MKYLFALLPLIALAPSSMGRPTNSSCSRWRNKHKSSTSELTDSTLVNSDASEKWSAGGGKGSWNNSFDSAGEGAGWGGSDSSGTAPSASASSAVVVAPSADVSSAAAVAPADASSTSLAAGAALATGSASDSGSSSVSAVAAASTDPATSSAAPAAASSSAAAPTNSTDIDSLLSLHNNLRAQYGASAVTWNDTLAAYAQADANTCVYGHTDGSYGENIAAVGGTGTLDLSSDFASWANEAAEYDWNSPGYTDATGHFTQIVWKATTQIGCGWQTCGPDTIFTNFTEPSLYLVCEYMARGNIVDTNNQAFIDNVGTYGS